MKCPPIHVLWQPFYNLRSPKGKFLKKWAWSADMQRIIDLYLSNRVLFYVYKASSQHREGSKNLRQFCKTREIVEGLHNFRKLCGSRKYPYPHHGGIGNSEGEWGSKTQEIPEEREVVWSI